MDASGLTGSGGIIPNTGEGVGAFKMISSGTGQALSPPQGGTWVWITFLRDVNVANWGFDALRRIHQVGVSEGRETISPAGTSGIQYQAAILRIA